MKQVIVQFNGKFQFSLKSPETETLLEVAQRAAKAMNVKPKKILTGPGVVNLVTHS